MAGRPVTDAPPLTTAGPTVLALACALIADVSSVAAAPGVAAHPKPRVRLRNDAPPLFLCGWCSKWDVAENLRTNGLTGNCWPIHPSCVVEWYDGGPQAKP